MLISPAAACEEVPRAFRCPVMARGNWNEPDAAREKVLDAASMTVTGRALRQELHEPERQRGAEQLPEAASGAADSGGT